MGHLCYCAAMLLSLAKVAPGRIDKAALLVPSGITHGPLLPIMTGMSIPAFSSLPEPMANTIRATAEQMLSRAASQTKTFYLVA